MIIPDDKAHKYLLHWSGEQQLTTTPFVTFQKNLEGNRCSTDILQTYGQSIITAYVGFIDLAGFSTQVQGNSPDQIAEYLHPFLTRTVNLLTGSHALVDKMIGDEIMFVLPEYEGLDVGGTLLIFGQLLGGLHDLAFELGPNYKYRIGLSYGQVKLFHLQGVGYSEWSIVGEPIHVAKRLHSVEELASPNPVCGAYGLSLTHMTLEAAVETMRTQLGIFAGFASRFGHDNIRGPIELKGVGSVAWAYLQSKRASPSVGLGGGQRAT